MDPFARTIAFAVAVIVFFFVAVVVGRLAAARISRNAHARQAISAIVALGIFLVLFFVGRRLAAP